METSTAYHFFPLGSASSIRISILRILPTEYPAQAMQNALLTFAAGLSSGIHSPFAPFL